MIRFCAAVAALWTAVTAHAQPAELPPGRTVEWTFAAHPAPVQYRSGDLTITIRGVRTREDKNMIEPHVTVARPGRRPQVIRSIAATPVMPAGLSVGRLEASGARFVMWQAYTGGAHCCFDIQLILPDEPGSAIVALGSFDMEMMAQVPSDVDGDGRTDFVLRDNRFNYTFASYAGSFAPPQILNVVNGRRVDVSAAPRYRRLFLEAMNETRENCLSSSGDRNGACASWMAAAARAGQFERAWAEMLPAYERGTDWIYPTGCRVTPGPQGCPEDQTIRHDFPTALRLFLRRNGYLPR